MICAFWCGHTDRSRLVAQIVRDSIAALGWKEEYAAHLMRITPAQFSRQLAGVESLSAWRLAELPDEFQREYEQRRAALRGARVLEATELSLVRGFCAMPKRQMLKMTEPKRVTLPLQKEQAS